MIETRAGFIKLTPHHDPSLRQNTRPTEVWIRPEDIRAIKPSVELENQTGSAIWVKDVIAYGGGIYDWQFKESVADVFSAIEHAQREKGHV